MEGGVAALVDVLFRIHPRCRGGWDIFVRLNCQRGRSASHDVGLELSIPYGGD
jgi:hypothetical protein